MGHRVGGSLFGDKGGVSEAGLTNARGERAGTPLEGLG